MLATRLYGRVKSARIALLSSALVIRTATRAIRTRGVHANAIAARNLTTSHFGKTSAVQMRVITVPCLTDNYAYVLLDEHRCVGMCVRALYRKSHVTRRLFRRGRGPGRAAACARCDPRARPCPNRDNSHHTPPLVRFHDIAQMCMLNAHVENVDAQCSCTKRACSMRVRTCSQIICDPIYAH